MGRAMRATLGSLTMRHASIGDVALAYEVRGDGEPILSVHGGVIADWFTPVVAQPILADRYRLIRYHRAGYGESGRIARSVSVAEMATHPRHDAATGADWWPRRSCDSWAPAVTRKRITQC
jgi:pimeloyl-ACP methyl ester carboxylesterase